MKDFAVHGDAALSRLPERVRRLVVELGLDRPALARAAIESGRLVWLEGNAAILWNGKMVPHSAGRTWELLNAWAGLPYRPRRRWR